MKNKTELGNSYYLVNNEVHFENAYAETDKTIFDAQQVHAIELLLKEYTAQNLTPKQVSFTWPRCIKKHLQFVE